MSIQPLNKNKLFTAIKFVVLALSCLAYIKLTFLILLFFPGVLIFYYGTNRSVSENIAYSIALSISYWISGFWILKYLPITFSSFIFFSFLFSILLIAIRRRTNVFYEKFQKSDLVSIFFVLVIITTIIPIFRNQLAPAGADMATHSYIAKLIVENNNFPKSYEPIASSEEFGSSYMGLSILIAALGNISNLSINQAGLYMSTFVYVFYGLSVFIFLSNFFSKRGAFFSAFFIIWIGMDVTNYFLWGGNPTILALSLLFFAFSFLTNLYTKFKLTVVNSFFIALLLTASFLSHPAPIVIGFYLVLGVILLNSKILKGLTKNDIVFLTYVSVFFLVIITPFLATVKVPSTEVFEEIKRIQRTSDDNTNWTGSIVNSFYTMPIYLKERMGYTLFLLSISGIFLSLFKPNKINKLFLFSIIIEMILIINSQYWFLPLSPLLFPDRVVTVGLIPFSFFIAVLFEAFFVNIGKLWNTADKNFTTIFTFIVSLGFLLVFFVSDFWQRNTWLRNQHSSYVSVTQDDLNVFKYINLHTSTNDVFMNNYGDSGIWIPALAYRKITNYDATLFDAEKFKSGNSKYSANYLFIGSKPVYEERIQFKYSELKNSLKYEEVYKSGNAHLFRIKKE